MKKTILLICFATIGLSSQVFSQCIGGHSTDLGDAWISCVGAQNPNPNRSEEHWIMYDFGAVYTLEQSHFWNYNVTGSTDNGIQDFTIDYSLNGTDWIEFTTYTLFEAPGAENYLGESGPDFSGIDAQFVLLSITSNYGGDCYGFAEMKLNVSAVSTDIVEPTASALEFGVYPNPVSEYFTVQLDDPSDKQIRLLAISGALIQAISPYSPTTRVQVGALAPGIYLLQVIDDQGLSGIKRIAVTR